jgi:hypothetical protein
MMHTLSFVTGNASKFLAAQIIAKEFGIVFDQNPLHLIEIQSDVHK